MNGNPKDLLMQDDLELQTRRQRGVFVKLYPDTKLASEWYEGEFSVRGGFAKSYLIGLGEMLEMGIADKQPFAFAARDVFEVAKNLSEDDAAVLLKLGWILSSTKDNPKYSYVRRLLEVLASWPVHSESESHSIEQEI